MSAGGVFAGTNAVSIKALLGDSDGKLVVPRFQRNYAWDTDENVGYMWNDLLNNFRIYRRGRDTHDIQLTEESQYLLGPIVLVEVKTSTGKKYLVVDGQQRLATLTILLCCIRDIYAELPQDEQDGQRMLRTIDDMIRIRHHNATPWRFEANAINRDVLRFVQEFDPNNPSTIRDECKNKNKYDCITAMLRKKGISDSNKKIYEAYQYFYKQISDVLRTNFTMLVDKESRNDNQLGDVGKQDLYELNEFVEYIIRNNYVVQIILPNENTAYLVFESLNSKNLDLAKSDLIKNHILRTVGTENKELQDELSLKWDYVFDKLVKTANHDRFVVESLRSRLDLQGSLAISDTYSVTDMHLYKIIKDSIQEKNPKKDEVCRKFVADLEDDATFLRNLYKPDNYTNKETKDDIQTLDMFKAKFVRFVVLAAHRRWLDSKDQDSYTKIVKCVVKFFFKYRVVGKGHPSRLEAIMLDLVRKINRCEPLEEILLYVKKIDDHDDFKFRFERLMKKPTRNFAKYVLYQITHELSSRNTDVKPISDLTLEHILPRNYSKHWKSNEFFEGDSGDETMREYVVRLGNITLLHKKVNPSIRDNVFADKRHAYEQSNLSINKETVCCETAWTANAITRRELKFLNLADKIWSLDI